MANGSTVANFDKVAHNATVRKASARNEYSHCGSKNVSQFCHFIKTKKKEWLSARNPHMKHGETFRDYVDRLGHQKATTNLETYVWKCDFLHDVIYNHSYELQQAVAEYIESLPQKAKANASPSSIKRSRDRQFKYEAALKRCIFMVGVGVDVTTKDGRHSLIKCYKNYQKAEASTKRSQKRRLRFERKHAALLKKWWSEAAENDNEEYA